jgi:hypothetical protein
MSNLVLTPEQEAEAQRLVEIMEPRADLLVFTILLS